MKKEIRFVVLLLVFLMVVSTFAGCGTGGKDQDGTTTAEGTAEPGQTDLKATWPEFKEHHEAQIVCFEMGWTGPVKDKDVVTPEIEKRTNFLLKYESMTVATTDAYNQKLNLMVATGEVPEIFFGGIDSVSRNIYSILGKDDLIWDLSSIIKDYKNLYALLKPELILYRDLGSKANYVIPTQTGRGIDMVYEVPSDIFIREDFLKQLNMEYPKTPEELYTYLKRCKDEIKTVNGKDIIPLTFDENLGNMESFLSNMFASLYTIPPRLTSNNGLTYDEHTNKVYNYGYTDSAELMAMAKYINKLYREGLLDPEILTQKRAQYEEKISQGRVAFFGGEIWDMNTLSNIAIETVPDLMYVVPPKPIAEAGTPKYPTDKWTNFVGSYSGLIISKELDEETVRHFLALLDYIATRDGQILVNWGIEGVTFDYDSNGKAAYTDDFKNNTNQLNWVDAAAYGVYYWQQLALDMTKLIDINYSNETLNRPDNKKSWENQELQRSLYDSKMDPPKGYYLVPGETETKMKPALDQAKLEMWAKVIAAKSDTEVEQIVHTWAQTAKDMGIDDIIAERQNYFDTFDINAE
jgi:putative aldouronate transport system substrate-binding protein